MRTDLIILMAVRVLLAAYLIWELRAEPKR